MGERCEDCGRPFAASLDDVRAGTHCGTSLPRVKCNDSDWLDLNCAAHALAAKDARIRELEREVKAWRFLERHRNGYFYTEAFDASQGPRAIRTAIGLGCLLEPEAKGEETE